MAEKKNFTIENYNGTDYDTLYPETNSGQVLLDSDARVELKLESGSTLDDAIHTIAKDGAVFQVGDTLTTARTNLGNKWLLCNGAQVTNVSYPELAPMFESKELDFVSSGSVLLSQFNNGVRKLSLAVNNDGSQFLLSGYSNKSTQFLYTTDLYDASKYQTAFTQDIVSTHYYSVGYINNVWFALEYINGGLLYYKDGGITSEQKQVPLGTSVSGGGYPVYFDALPIYYNEKYYILGHYKDSGDNTNYVMCMYTTLDTIPTVISFPVYGKISTLLPDGICGASNVNNRQKMNVKILNNNNQVISHTYTNFDGVSSGKTAIYYLNGYYYLFNSNDTETKIYRSTNLNSMTLYKTLDAPIYLPRALQVDNKVIFSNGYYLDATGNINPWSNYVASADSNYETNIVAGGGKYWRIVNNNPNATFVPYYTFQEQSFTLPTVSIANTLYTYIKAKS